MKLLRFYLFILFILASAFNQKRNKKNKKDNDKSGGIGRNHHLKPYEHTAKTEFTEYEKQVIDRNLIRKGRKKSEIKN